MASTITVSEEVSKKENLLSLAGAWSDMSDSEEEELVKEIHRAWRASGVHNPDTDLLIALLHGKESNRVHC